MALEEVVRKDDPKKSERLEVRVTESVKEDIKRAAHLQGRSMSEFVATNAHEAAVKTISEHNTIHLSKESSRLFVESLLNPPEPSDALKKAAKRYKEINKSK